MSPNLRRRPAVTEDVLRSLVRITLAVTILIAAAVALIRQPVLTSIDYGSNQRANPRALRKHVDFLTIDVRPRGAQHPENLHKAAAYIAAEFAKSGAVVTTQPFNDESYWAAGMRAVLVTDTAFLRNPNYHTMRDTAETLDYERMAGVVDGIFNSIR